MEQAKNKEIIFTKMNQEETPEDITNNNAAWSKGETLQVFWYFIIAFVVLLGFGFLINRFLL